MEAILEKGFGLLKLTLFIVFSLVFVPLMVTVYLLYPMWEEWSETFLEL